VTTGWEDGRTVTTRRKMDVRIEAIREANWKPMVMEAGIN
jgi:hypothetical protein